MNLTINPRAGPPGRKAQMFGATAGSRLIRSQRDGGAFRGGIGHPVTSMGPPLTGQLRAATLMYNCFRNNVIYHLW